MLVKVRAEGLARAEVKRTCDLFRGQIVDVTERAYIVQLVGAGDKLDAFLRAIDRAAILELVRSGLSGISRGEKAPSL